MVSDDVRNELCRLARSRKTRTHVFDRARPTHWAPYELRDPGSGDTFTADSAWEFVADLIEGGVEIATITLDIPAGKTGYVIKVDGAGGDRIYIKLQLSSGKVIGRSFHASKNEDET
jgi:hypothetical protein